MKAKKIWSWVVLPILIILLVLVAGFYFFSETLIARAVEKSASTTLGVPVTIKGIDLSLLRGQVGIRGLVVKNPPGYANDTLLELGEGVVNLDIKSLMSDTVKINLIKLDGTKLTMEQKGLSSNLKDILDNLPQTEKAASEEKGKNLNITRLEITNTNVKVKLLPLPGKADTVSLNIDPIIMTDLGGDKKLNMGVLSAKILSAISMGIAKQGAVVLPRDMVNGIGSALGKTADIGKAATKEGQKLLETTAGAGKGVIDGFKGLLGGKKSEPNK
jgi:hypothetical protein